MIYTEKTIKALNFAYQKHHNQLDKAGAPYIFHPYYLANQMETEETTIIALLHDVVEDTDTTFEDIEKLEFGENVVSALKLLTHDKKVDYFEYIENLSTNKLAITVKLADLKHNSDLSRLPEITNKDLKRYEKYQKCIKFLEEKLNCT